MSLILTVLVVLAAMVMPAVADEVDDLISDLKYGTAVVREGAAWNLGMIGDTRAVDPLIDALKDEEKYVRTKAAMALGYIGDTRAVDPLIDALKDEEAVVRKEASGTLGWIGDPRAVDPLIEALKDDDSLVREYAAMALGGIGDPRAVEALIEALKDENPYVQSAASDALDKMVDVTKCQWDSYTPDQTAFVGQQGGVFPLRNSPFVAGNYLVLVGPAGDDGLDLPPATWNPFGPYELKGGHKYKATIESPRGESLQFEEDPTDLLSYSDPSPGYASVYVRNGCPGDIWSAICLQPINPIVNTSMMSDEGGECIISLGDTTEVDEITPEMTYT